MARTAKTVTAPVVDIFAAASVQEAPKKKSKASTKVEVKVDGLSVLASLNALKVAVESKIAAYRDPIDDAMRNFFVTNGAKNAARPANFTGFEDNATASCELRKRVNTSTLTDEEVEILEGHEIPVGTSVTQEERFYFNQEVLDDPDMRAKISAAFAAAGIPSNVILRQEKIERPIVTDETIEAVFATGDEDIIRETFDIVGTLGLKPKIDAEASIENIIAKAVSAGFTLSDTVSTKKKGK